MPSRLTTVSWLASLALSSATLPADPPSPAASSGPTVVLPPFRYGSRLRPRPRAKWADSVALLAVAATPHSERRAEAAASTATLGQGGTAGLSRSKNRAASLKMSARKR